ncbi:Uncharacterised protein [Mycobacterium tuberculosis]|uniref:Uncharacterized protein n=1 Tax=Mycobacterium tuberculosis TaxID=1773 RepID=A0A654U3R3_MYCTX|nr:Uncharacterised protein [Mycobacterium tuberculosis]
MHTVALAPPRDQIGNDLALRADHGCAYLLDDLQHSVSAAFGVVGVGLFGQGGLVVYGHVQFRGEWLHRLVAAHPVGGINIGGAERQQLWYQRFCLRTTPLV